jgi:effector-binding domain-containing protein
MVSNFQVKTLSAQAALVFRTRASVRELGKLLPTTFEAVFQYLTALGAQPAGAPFAVYYNDDFKNFDVGIGFPTAGPLPGVDKVQSTEIAAGKYAACLYSGPYAHLEEAYRALDAWMDENHLPSATTAYEIYLSNPSETPPAELQTLVMKLLR